MPASIFGPAQRETDRRLHDTAGPYTMADKGNQNARRWALIDSLVRGGVQTKARDAGAGAEGLYG